jgi:putative two-component system response regulator
MAMRILIVDDNAIALEMLSHTLTEGGHEVERASDGRSALEIVRKGKCHLVISDWEMPHMSGIELCRAIRREDLDHYVYVIVVTAHDSAQDKVQGLESGADDFITKPFDPPELLARVGTAERVLSLETRDVAIFALAKLAESRDPETGAHLDRVREYSRSIAQQLAGVEAYRGEVNGEFIRLIYLTSPLHDIGKVAIPDAVLLKPGRLSDREFEIMKTHAAMGAQTLDAALRQFPGVKFLEMARDIALTHHERVDGTGYPAGLAGKNIPLCGRIVALADVYDALSSRRIYKDAFTHDIARSMILAETGVHFDLDVIMAFRAAEEHFRAIRVRFAEPQHAAAA